MADNTRIEKFKELLANEPRNPMLHFGLGNELLKHGRHTEAAKSYQAAIEANPRYTAAYRQLGKALEQSNQRQAAQNAYRSGIAIGNDVGDLQTVKEMRVFLRRLEAQLETPEL